MFGIKKQHKRKAGKVMTLADGGQAILEFTLCMIVVLLMIYALAKIFIWTGRDIVERRMSHDASLRSLGSQLQQIDPDFHVPGKLDAVWDGN